MKKHLFAALVLTAGAGSAGAQGFPEDWGNRMQAVMDSVNAAQGNAIGTTAAIYMPGYGLWTGATGISSPGVPMTTDLRVLIGSNTKLFLAVTMLRLQEQGILSLDDRIGRWIHYGPVTVDTTATIRQLLSHESGMRDWYNDYTEGAEAYMWADTSAVIGLQTSVDSAGTPIYPKGRGFHYTNSAYSLCGMIIKEATGMEFWEVMRSEVFDPLDMDSTFMPVYEPYQPICGTNFEGTLFSGYGFTSFITQDAPAASLASTPQEMVQWYQKLFGGEVLTEASMKELLDFDPSSMYSMGLWETISPRVGGEYYHSGANGAFLSEALYDKDTKASIFIATNTIIGSDYYPGQYLAPLLDVFVHEMPQNGADAGIVSVTSPRGTTCDPFIHPEVVLKNYGSEDLLKAIISYSIDGSFAGGYTWTGTLAPGASTSVALPAGLLTHGYHTLQVNVSQPAGSGGTGHTWNNTLSYGIVANLSTDYMGAFSEDFEGTATPLLVWNEDQCMEGQAGVTELTGYSSTHSLARPCASNPDFGNVSNIDLPVIRLEEGAQLSFRYAYKNRPDAMEDSLEVLISADCGDTWISLFHKGGDDLSQGETSEIIYYPQTAAEWIAENIPLAAYTGDVLIRFRQHNGQGNNLYIDDISVGSPTGVQDIAGDLKMELYPNPTPEHVTVSGLPPRTVVRITDISGKLLLETATGTGNTTELNLGSLTPGIYLLHTSFGTRKLVKL